MLSHGCSGKLQSSPGIQAPDRSRSVGYRSLCRFDPGEEQPQAIHRADARKPIPALLRQLEASRNFCCQWNLPGRQEGVGGKSVQTVGCVTWWRWQTEDAHSLGSHARQATGKEGKITASWTDWPTALVQPIFPIGLERRNASSAQFHGIINKQTNKGKADLTANKLVASSPTSLKYRRSFVQGIVWEIICFHLKSIKQILVGPAVEPLSQRGV